MRNPSSGVITDPNTFQLVTRLDGYWVVKGNDLAIGVMYGNVLAAIDEPFPSEPLPNGVWLRNDGTVTIVTNETTHYLKPITRAEFESAREFGFGTMYDPTQLPDLMKLPDEITLDNS